MVLQGTRDLLPAGQTDSLGEPLSFQKILELMD